MDVFAEQLFVSVCRHAFPNATTENPGEVRVAFEYRPNPSALKVTIADDGAPHDPLSEIDTPTPDVADESTGPTGSDQGGAGKPDIVDEATYERVNDRNVVSFMKSW